MGLRGYRPGAGGRTHPGEATLSRRDQKSTCREVGLPGSSGLDRPPWAIIASAVKFGGGTKVTAIRLTYLWSETVKISSRLNTVTQ